MAKKSIEDKKSIEEFEQEYILVESKLKQYEEVLFRELNNLLVPNNIEPSFPITSRVKTWSSVMEKIQSERFVPENSVLQFQDLVGLRIVLPFTKDVNKMSNLVKNKFSCTKDELLPKSSNGKEFGYSSHHLVVKLPGAWQDSPAMKELGGLLAEIQVRTLSQHAWAEASRILQYKQEKDTPITVQRSFSRVSAMLEIVDLEFGRLLSERADYKNTLKTAVGLSAVADEKLNVDILMQVLENRLPAQNRSHNDNFENILRLLNKYKIKTLREFNELVDTYLDAALNDERSFVERANKFDVDQLPREFIKERIKQGVHLTFYGLINNMLQNYKPYPKFGFNK